MPTNLEDPSNIFEKLEYGISIHQKTRNDNLVIWDQYIPKKNITCVFCNLRSFETLQLWNIGTLKRGNQGTKTLFSAKGIPTTPQHTDSHSCASPLLGWRVNLGDTSGLEVFGRVEVGGLFNSTRNIIPITLAVLHLCEAPYKGRPRQLLVNKIFVAWLSLIFYGTL